MIGTLQEMLTTRDRCNHNLRIMHLGKSNICLICHCAKIDDTLKVECTGNRKLSSACISDIIYQFRIINSVLDVPIEPSNVEKLMSPVMQTSKALLEIHQDEVGDVVAQALDKISSKVPLYMLENFLKDLSAQILEKTSFGNLESLSVLIRRKECLNSFLKNHGRVVLPKLFQVLEDNVTQCFGKTDSAGPSSNRLKTLEKLFEVLIAMYPNDVLMLSNRSSCGDCSEITSSMNVCEIFNLHLPSLISSSRITLQTLLENATVGYTGLAIKNLSLLEELHHHPHTLRCGFSDTTGINLCSIIKRLLYSKSEEVKTAALSLLHRMVLTYTQVMENEEADKAFIADLPSAISQVDLIYFITEAMTTSSEKLFKTAVQVLHQINSIPLFGQGRMIPALESILRVSTVLIPNNITRIDTYRCLNMLILNILRNLDLVTCAVQRQLIYLFEKLPATWTSSEYLPWVKLLLFCNEPELRSSIWSIFLTFIQRTKDLDSSYFVSSLKCVLFVAYTLIKGKGPAAAAETDSIAVPVSAPEDLSKQLMYNIMDVCFLPSTIALVRFGKSDDAKYVSILLELLLNYPVECLTPCQIAFENQTTMSYSVTYDSEAGGGHKLLCEKNDPVYEINANEHFISKSTDVRCWSANFYMQILGDMRINTEFITCRSLYELWNKNVARIMSSCYRSHLPQLRNVIQDCISECDEEPVQSIIEGLLQKLDIDVKSWSDVVSRTNVFGTGIGWNESVRASNDLILAFYYFFTLFAGKSISKFLDKGFPARFCELLNECVVQAELTQEMIVLEWNSISFYFRVALIIIAALPHESAKFLDAFERLLDVHESQSAFKDDLMVYHTNVFVCILQWRIFPEYASLVEKWLSHDSPACIEFYTNGNFDEQTNSELNNSLITLAAKGDERISTLAVELGEKRSKRIQFSYEFNFVKTHIHDLAAKILLMDEQFLEPIDLLRFSNVIKLSADDDYLFASDNHFPLPFLHKLLRVTLKYSNKSMIGRRSMELLCKILGDNTTLNEANHYLVSDKEFIQFLGNKLTLLENLGNGWETVEVQTQVAESVLAHKLLALLIRTNLTEFKDSRNKNPIIRWKLVSVLTYIHEVPKVEILEFLVALFQTNFSCPLIQAVEINQTSADFAKVLLNLLFHVQALTQKIAFRKAKEAVWEILFEYLRFSDGRTGTVVTDSTFQMDVVFQPWMKVAVTHLLVQQTPSRAPVMALKFLRKWTRTILEDRLQNRTKRSFLQEIFVVHQYAGVFRTIKDAMEKDPSQAAETKRQRISDASPDNPSLSSLYDIEPISELISQIAKNCSIFLAT